MIDTPFEVHYERAARAISEASALLITAGAGMGVDSGLPDFRGPEGFWRAYPPFRALNLKFEQVSTPKWFHTDPAFAWGFYGHRMMLYRRTVPHAGFALLKKWADAKPLGGFVFTSNVDCAFQKSGFPADRLVECHGTTGLLQCLSQCGAGIFPSDGVEVDVDEVTFRAREPLPTCPRCGGLARPNVLMFGDWDWIGDHTAAQEERLERWLHRVKGEGGKLAVVEMGAGTGVPTVRRTSERVAHMTSGTLVRINLREPEVPSSGIGLPAGALAALTELDRRLSSGEAA